MIFNPEKKCNKVELFYDKTSLERVKAIKYLGVFLDENLNCSRHIAHVETKLSTAIGVLYRLKNYVSKDILKIVYYSLTCTYFHICNNMLGECSCKISLQLQAKQNRIVKIISKINIKRTQLTPLYKKTTTKFSKLKE